MNPCEEGEIEFLMEELAVSRTYRYINRLLIYRINRINIIEKLQSLTDREFKAVLRISLDSFKKLLNLIFDHDVFKSRNHREQKEIAGQLATTLDRLGHNGNGMESTRLGGFSGTGVRELASNPLIVFLWQSCLWGHSFYHGQLHNSSARIPGGWQRKSFQAAWDMLMKQQSLFLSALPLKETSITIAIALLT
ncbi:hypothetical protein BGZ51_002576 [Haplosporangium sp. Z 767]|nr:hypothetical protein BGZ51_002576 [Haplosporangium sp. Z 767]